MEEITLSLALLDFVPVLFTAVGFFYLIRLVSSVLPAQGRIAFVGGTLVIVGGFFKALWKLLMALSNSTLDIAWMDDGLFVFLAPGYVLFSWSIWQVARSVQGKRVFHAWLVPVMLTLAVLGSAYSLYTTSPTSPAWERVLLTVTVLANFISGILLITFAFGQKLSKAGWLFIVNLVAVFAMNGLARMPQLSISMHWVAEAMNTVSSLCFAAAAWILYMYIRANYVGEVSVDARLAATAK